MTWYAPDPYNLDDPPLYRQVAEDMANPPDPALGPPAYSYIADPPQPGQAGDMPNPLTAPLLDTVTPGIPANQHNDTFADAEIDSAALTLTERLITLMADIAATAQDIATEVAQFVAAAKADHTNMQARIAEFERAAAAAPVDLDPQVAAAFDGIKASLADGLATIEAAPVAATAVASTGAPLGSSATVNADGTTTPVPASAAPEQTVVQPGTALPDAAQPANPTQPATAVVQAPAAVPGAVVSVDGSIPAPGVGDPSAPGATVAAPDSGAPAAVQPDGSTPASATGDGSAHPADTAPPADAPAGSDSKPSWPADSSASADVKASDSKPSA